MSGFYTGLRCVTSRSACALVLVISPEAPLIPRWQSKRRPTVKRCLKWRGEENAGNYSTAENVPAGAGRAPENLEVQKRLGVLEQTELKFDDSIRLFKRVLAGDPSYKGVNFFLGLSYFGKNEFLPSIDYFERELKTPKPHPRTQYYLGLALQSAGRIDEAISHLNQSLAQDPKDADALYELARLHKNASLHSIEALKAWTRIPSSSTP